MPVVVKNGHGTGWVARVDEKGRLYTDAAQRSAVDNQTESYESVYSFSNVTYNYTAGDTILLVKNTHPSKEMTIAKIWVSGDTATQVLVHVPVADVTPTGTAVTGVNLKSPSSKVAVAVAIGDETNNTQGLVLWSQFIPAAEVVEVDCGSGIKLATNKSIGVDYVTVGAAALVTIWAYWKDLE